MLKQIKHWLFKLSANRTINKRDRTNAFTTPVKPMTEWNVAFLTTAGVHLKEQEAFDVDAGDPSVRLIPSDADPDQLMITHTHYDTAEADKDTGAVFPLEALKKLANEGRIGSVAKTHYGMMGYIPETDRLEKESIPVILKQLKKEHVDVLLLSPG